MRRIWVSILIMAVTLALALGNGWYLQRLTGGMALELENAQILAEEGNLDGARELTGQVYDRSAESADLPLRCRPSRRHWRDSDRLSGGAPAAALAGRTAGIRRRQCPASGTARRAGRAGTLQRKESVLIRPPPGRKPTPAGMPEKTSRRGPFIS